MENSAGPNPVVPSPVVLKGCLGCLFVFGVLFSLFIYAHSAMLKDEEIEWAREGVGEIEAKIHRYRN